MSGPRHVDVSTADLVARTKAGDRDAFQDLVTRHHAQIYRWALVRVGDADEAEDITQEVLVRMHDRIHQFRGESHFTTWLFQITRNAATGWFRRRARRDRAHDAHVADLDVTQPERGADAIHASDLAELVRVFFTQLPARQREIFDLVDLQGHSPIEAARMLGVEPVTARVHLLRARRAIRGQILARYPELAPEGSS